MKRKKKPVATPLLPLPADQRQSMIKVGTQVLCFTQYTVDKTTVESVNKKDKTAILENRTQISAVIHQGGSLQKLGKVLNVNDTYRVWSEEAEEEFMYKVAIQNIASMLNTIGAAVKDAPKSDVLAIYSKVCKLMKKYDIVRK